MLLRNIQETLCFGQGMLFYHIVVCKNFGCFVSVIRLVFVDVKENKGYESLVTKADVCVETFDVATCSKDPILRVVVATDTMGLLDQVDETCGTIGRCCN